jgi:hypothetical protein
MLPSGRILGHRALKVYYSQNLRPARPEGGSTVSKLALVKQQLADPTQALIPVAGGTGNHGRGLQTMKARNAGEAKWARAEARSFKDMKARSQHFTRVAFKHNSMKRESKKVQWTIADDIDFRDEMREWIDWDRSYRGVTDQQSNRVILFSACGVDHFSSVYISHYMCIYMQLRTSRLQVSAVSAVPQWCTGLLHPSSALDPLHQTPAGCSSGLCRGSPRRRHR